MGPFERPGPGLRHRRAGHRRPCVGGQAGRRGADLEVIMNLPHEGLSERFIARVTGARASRYTNGSCERRASIIWRQRVIGERRASALTAGRTPSRSSGFPRTSRSSSRLSMSGKLEQFLQMIDSEIVEGLATLEQADVHFYRSGRMQTELEIGQARRASWRSHRHDAGVTPASGQQAGPLWVGSPSSGSTLEVSPAVEEGRAGRAGARASARRSAPREVRSRPPMCTARTSRTAGRGGNFLARREIPHLRGNHLALGVTLAEDSAALSYLASRPDVDSSRLGCGGLSGRGMRSVFLAGQDSGYAAPWLSVS